MNIMNGENPSFSVSMTGEQVRYCTDAINSHDALVEQNKALIAVIKEADEYLDYNDMTNIGSGSGIHMAFKYALEQAQ